MKAKDIIVGQTYLAKVSGRRAHVHIEAVSPYGGWLGRNFETGRQVRIRSPRRLQPSFPGAVGGQAIAGSYDPTRRNPHRPGPIHYAAMDPTLGYVPACGAETTPGRTTPDRRFVGCKKCLRWLASTVSMSRTTRRSKNPESGRRAPKGAVAPLCEYPGCGRSQVWIPWQGWQCRNWIFHQAGQASGGRQVPPSEMLGSFQRNPSGRRRRYDPGQRIRVRPGSGASSGMTGVIVPRFWVQEPKRGEQRGFPFLPGYYKPIDWTREAAIVFDSGVVGTMWKDRLELI